MPLRVRSPKGRLNFFSGRRDRIKPPIRAFEGLRISPGKRTNTERPRTRFSELAGKSIFRCRITPVASETFVDQGLAK